MQKFIDWYKTKQDNVSEKSIAPLDGIRALLVLMVAVFHIWQQSWLTPTFRIGNFIYSTDYILRTGYLWVDGLILLSGFLLYLPYAAANSAQNLPKISSFYKNRALRILPSYYFCIFFILLVFVLPEGQYKSTDELSRDLISHLTFTHTFSIETYYHTKLNGVLWTLAVEVQFYLIFPFVARAFKKSPFITYLTMTGIAFIFRAYAAGQESPQLLFNQLPAFLDVYANGFVAASCFVAIQKKLKDDKWTRIFMTVIVFMCVYVLLGFAYRQAQSPSVYMIQIGQMARRFGISVALSMLFIAVSLGAGFVKILLGSKIMRFLSAISFQFYMWHQFIALKLKQYNIPKSSFAEPHKAGDFTWQISYIILFFVLSIGVSALLTYLLEKPIIRIFRKGEKRL